MVRIINPFDEIPGFTLAELTEAINLIPNEYGRVGELNLFPAEGVTTTAILVNIEEGTLSLLPSVARGGPPTLARRDKPVIRPFAIPHFPHDDVVTPEDLQGIPANFSDPAVASALGVVMAKRLARCRAQHAQTLEFMRIGALKGLVRDGAGSVVANLFDTFEVTQYAVDLRLGDNTTDVAEKFRGIRRFIRKNLKGGQASGVHALVGPELWDKFIKHDSVRGNYQFFTGLQNQNPLHNDLSGGFKFQEITVEEYDATFTLADGASPEDAFAGPSGVAFPKGLSALGATYNAPANWLETVNTQGQEQYAKQIVRPDGTGVDVKTQSNPLPIWRRPILLVRLYSSN